jgi:hypothetical protein
MRAQRRRVAQKLAYARWHLSWSDSPEGVCGDSAELGAQQRESLLQSALFHLVGAYRAFLAEIAADIHLVPDGAQPDIRSARHLSASYSDYLPPALAQCVNLEGASIESDGRFDAESSWLSMLLGWFEDIDRIDDAMARGAPTARDSGMRNDAMIAVSGECRRAPDRDGLAFCLEQMELLIERLREDLQEC